MCLLRELCDKMSQEIIASSIQRISSSCAFAAAATVFYKKNFAEPMLPIAASLTALGFCIDYWHTFPVYAIAGCTLTCGALLYTSYVHRDWLKTAARADFFIPILLALVDVRFGPTLDIPHWIFIRIFAAAVPQFLRKPLWLKNMLQDVRSKLGPMYVLFVTAYSMSLNANDTPALVFLLSQLAFCSAVLAGVFFRPDNSTMLNVCASLMNVPYRTDLIPYKTTLIQRRNVHRRLMVTSFVCCAFLFGRELMNKF